MSIWATAFAKQGTNVAYQAIGSGGGVAQIQAQTVDFGDSDVPLLDTELAAAKGGPILHIPLTLGGVVVAYNVKGLATGLHLDGQTIGKIFDGEITNWSDPAIKKLNPKASLPNEPIAVAHRSDGSGTTGIFTDFLTKTSPAWTAKLGGPTTSQGKTVAWPVGIGGKGSDGVTAIVNQQEGGIGYVELSYALSQHLHYAYVKNPAGNFIQPCVATVRIAVAKAKFPTDLRASLTNEPGPNAYPITGTTYALVYQNQTDPSKAKALVNFLSWVLSTGQNFPASIGYAPEGATLEQKALAQIGKIKLNGTPVVKVKLAPLSK